VPLDSIIVVKRSTRWFSLLALTFLKILKTDFLDSRSGGWIGSESRRSSGHSTETASLMTKAAVGWGSTSQSEKNSWANFRALSLALCFLLSRGVISLGGFACFILNLMVTVVVVNRKMEAW
jgi:hypothetical protein